MLWLGFLAPLLAAGLLASGDSLSPQKGRFHFELLSEHPVPPAIERPMDVRWASETSIFIADFGGAILEISLPPQLAPPTFQYRASPTIGRRSRLAARLAVFGDDLVFGGPLFSVRWKKRGAAEVAGEHWIEYIGDLDLFRDRVVIVGGRRDAQGKFGGDGNIAWIGSLTRGLSDLSPLLPSQSGPGVRNMNACAVMDLAAVRFLADGSFVIVPGVDPNVFLYSPTATLARTWESDRLGLDAGCDIPDEQIPFFTQELEPRVNWINRRRIVDEILPLPRAAALVVRTFEDDGVRWKSIVLAEDGTVTESYLSFGSRSKWTRLKGDVAGTRVVFLLSESADPSPRPLLGSRILVARLH